MIVAEYVQRITDEKKRKWYTFEVGDMLSLYDSGNITEERLRWICESLLGEYLSGCDPVDEVD